MASLPVPADLGVLHHGEMRQFSAFKLDIVCQANSSLLPGYVGKVLRIRHIVLSPRFDFADDMTVEQYSQTLVVVFTGVLGLAYGEMASDHVKFHLKSPADRAFGGAFTEAVKDHKAFTKVEMKGSWIYLSQA